MGSSDKGDVMKRGQKDSEQERSGKTGRDHEMSFEDISPAHHKRVLKYINEAASPFDLMHAPLRPMSADQMADMDQTRDKMHKQPELMDAESARAIFDLR